MARSKTTWGAGRSGNPRGRPSLRSKDGKQIRALAQKWGARAFAKLTELLEDEDHRVALKACELVLERAYGKPEQPVELAGEVKTTLTQRIDVKKLTTEQKEELYRAAGTIRKLTKEGG